jgi:hypothetical protein
LCICAFQQNSKIHSVHTMYVHVLVTMTSLAVRSHIYFPRSQSRIISPQLVIEMLTCNVRPEEDYKVKDKTKMTSLKKSKTLSRNFSFGKSKPKHLRTRHVENLEFELPLLKVNIATTSVMNLKNICFLIQQFYIL